MEFEESKDLFIQHWGILATRWGINRTMAQIHALLLISPNSLTTDEIMEDLKISRGNANTNIRGLIDWGIVFKELKAGDRKEYFYSEKDIWKMGSIIANERKKREIDPVLEIMNNLKNMKPDESDEQIEFNKVISELYEFVDTTGNAFDKIATNKDWINKFIIKMLT